MKLPLPLTLLGATLLTLLTLVSGREIEPGQFTEGIEQICEQSSLVDPNSVLAIIKRNVAPMFPYDLYRWTAKYSMGDHVDWEELESYSIPEARWKRELVNASTELMEDFMVLVERHSQPPIEPYQHYQLFRAPNNVNDLWLTEVSLASDYIIHYIDKINIVLNGGIFSERARTFHQYQKASHKKKLALLKFLSEGINQIPLLEKEFFDFIKMARDEGFQKAFLADLEESFGPQVNCLYSHMSNLNLTLYNTIMETVPKEKLINYVQELVPELFKVINSIEAEFNMKSLIDAVKNTLKNTDFNKVTAQALQAFLQQRSLVLGMDLHQVFSRMDNVHKLLGEGWWRLTTGQWPEMLQFLTKFMEKTLKSERFWAKVQEVYLETVSNARRQYRAREEWMEGTIRDSLLPFLRDLLEKLRMTRTKDSSLVTNLVTRIEAVELTAPLERVMERVTGTLSRHFLSCYTKFYGKPDFNQLSGMASSNPIVRFLKSIVVADWPEEQKVPEGWPQFVEQLQEMVLLLVSSSLGSCTRPTGGL